MREGKPKKKNQSGMLKKRSVRDTEAHGGHSQSGAAGGGPVGGKNQIHPAGN